MTSWSLRTFSLIILIPILGCSNQWREGDAQIDGDEVLAMLDQVAGVSSESLDGEVTSSVSGMAEAVREKDNPDTTIFFADAPGPIGPVASVLALDNLDFLNLGEGLWYGNVSQAQIFFLDTPTSSGRHNGLVIGIGTGAGNSRDGGSDGQNASESATAYQYAAMSGQGSIENGEFYVEMETPSGSTLVLRSWDVDGDELRAVIQLQVYEVDSAGEEIYLGKFSTLVGFQ